MNVELARHQWSEGTRAVERARDDRAEYTRLHAYVAVLVDELTKRVGQHFTLDQLAGAYAASDRWTLEAVDDAFPDEVPSDVSTARNAAFDLYAHRASDYRP